MRPTKILPLVCMVIALAFIGRAEVEPSVCKVPYMYPHFQKVELRNVTTEDLRSRYALHAYREGSVFSGWDPKGVPVLFIPGNGGSYEQVRSLGSSSARYAAHIVSHELDFFSVDFRGELSAFDGEIMRDQSEFVNDCIGTLLQMYRHRDVSSVILIGHSIGGIVARGVFVHPNYIANSVETIITLAAPHTAPVLSIHKSVATFYDLVNRFWADKSHYAPGHALANMLLVSIAGGFRDVQVRSSNADLTGIVPPSHLLFVLSTAVPDVWTPTDHQAAVWCTQLNAQLLRGLFQAVDLRNAKPEPRLGVRYSAMQSALASGAPSRLGFAAYGGEYDLTMKPLESVPTQLASANDMTEQLVRLTKYTTQTTYRFNLGARRQLDFVAIWSHDLNLDLLVRDSQNQVFNLTGKAVLWPRSNRLLPSLVFVHLSSAQLSHYSDVFLHRRLGGSVRAPLLLAQFYANAESSLTLRLVDQPKVVAASHPLLVNATLMRGDRLLPYSLHTVLVACQGEETEAFAPFAYVLTEGQHEESLALNITRLRVRVDSLKPLSTHAVIVVDPVCTYQLSVRWDFGASIGSVLHAYISELVGFGFVVLLLTLARISKTWEESGTYNDFLSALNSVIVKDSFSLLTLIGGMSLFQRHAESLPISRILLAPDFVRNSYWYDTWSVHSPAWVYGVLYFLAIGGVAAGYVAISGLVYVVLGVRYVILTILRRRDRSPVSSRFRSLVFTVCFVAGIYTHSVIGLVLALVAFMVFMPLDEPADGFRAYQFALVTIYGLPVAIMVFSLIIWFKVYAYAWQWFDSYELLVAFITLHLSIASAPYPRNVQVSAAMYLLSAFVGFYALFRLYRVLHMVFILSVVLLFGHFVQPAAPPRVEWHHYK